jgi:hypothetical protein
LGGSHGAEAEHFGAYLGQISIRQLSTLRAFESDEESSDRCRDFMNFEEFDVFE